MSSSRGPPPSEPRELLSTINEEASQPTAALAPPQPITRGAVSMDCIALPVDILRQGDAIVTAGARIEIDALVYIGTAITVTAHKDDRIAISQTSGDLVNAYRIRPLKVILVGYLVHCL